VTGSPRLVRIFRNVVMLGIAGLAVGACRPHGDGPNTVRLWVPTSCPPLEVGRAATVSTDVTGDTKALSFGWHIDGRLDKRDDAFTSPEAAAETPAHLKGLRLSLMFVPTHVDEDVSVTVNGLTDPPGSASVTVVGPGDRCQVQPRRSPG
jgi:hypothetical protein